MQSRIDGGYPESTLPGTVLLASACLVSQKTAKYRQKADCILFCFIFIAPTGVPSRPVPISRAFPCTRHCWQGPSASWLCRLQHLASVGIRYHGMLRCFFDRMRARLRRFRCPVELPSNRRHSHSYAAGIRGCNLAAFRGCRHVPRARPIHGGVLHSRPSQCRLLS